MAKTKTKSTKPKARTMSKAKTNAGDAFIHLLQSPLVAELVAAAATAAISSYAGSSAGKGKKGAGKAVKAAGLAAASAIGQRLTTEVSAIRKAAKAKA